MQSWTSARTAVLACALASASSAWASDASKLGTDLTPLGGEIAGSKSGIPAWQAPQGPTAGWAPGKKRGDFWPHKAEKPLFVIDASNVDKYVDNLTAGQIAMLKQLPGYKMEVYPSHRSCTAPDFVAANSKKNADTAALADNGWGIKEATLPGVPFPIPKKGAEVIWNYKFHYRGVGYQFDKANTAVSPRRGGTDWIVATWEATQFFPWAVKGSRPLSEVADVEYYLYFNYSAPTALAGQALVQANYLSKANETFYYFPGQRRVRRMPAYAYDAPQIGFENQYTLDEPYLFNGLMDRFDWKLLGKKEIYVPYNAFGAYDPSSKLESFGKETFIDNASRRYELHRQWVVEATVKAGMRHTAPKRTFYVDEDSWVMLVAEDYDAQSKLSKVREGFLIPVYELGGACDAVPFVQYNLNDGRYLFDMNTSNTGKDIRWLTEPEGPRMKPQFYTSDNLRAISER